MKGAVSGLPQCNCDGMSHEIGNGVALRSLPWRIKTPASRIKRAETAGGRNARHYQSSEHQRWATAVKRRDGFACQKCGARDVRLIADHMIEIDDGGAQLDVNNGMTLCMACHNRKTAQTAQARRGRVETRGARGT